MIDTIATKNTITIPTQTGIHIGAVIHHQDQSIWFVNFSVKNIKNNIVPNPTPVLLVFSSLISFYFIGFKSGDNSKIPLSALTSK